MSTITPFEFESNKIRTIVDKDQNIWFVAKDVDSKHWGIKVLIKR